MDVWTDEAVRKALEQAATTAYAKGFDAGVEAERMRVKDTTLDAIGHYVDIDERTDLAEAAFTQPLDPRD